MLYPVVDVASATFTTGYTTQYTLTLPEEIMKSPVYPVREFPMACRGMHSIRMGAGFNATRGFSDGVYCPLAPSRAIFLSRRALRCSGTCSDGPNHVVCTEKPANHRMPHLSWAFTLPGRSHTIHGLVPLARMMRAVLPRNIRCQKTLRLPLGNFI